MPFEEMHLASWTVSCFFFLSLSLSFTSYPPMRACFPRPGCLESMFAVSFFLRCFCCFSCFFIIKLSLCIKSQQQCCEKCINTSSLQTELINWIGVVSSYVVTQINIYLWWYGCACVGGCTWECWPTKGKYKSKKEKKTSTMTKPKTVMLKRATTFQYMNTYIHTYICMYVWIRLYECVHLTVGNNVHAAVMTSYI